MYVGPACPVTMVLMATRGDDQHSYWMREFWPRSFRTTMKIVELVVITAGLFLVLGGIAATFAHLDSAIKQPAPYPFCAFMIVSGMACVWLWRGVRGKVVVNNGWIRVQNFRLRKVRIDQVFRIDILRSDFRGKERALPTVILKDGGSFRMIPLSWSPPSDIPSTSQITLLNRQMLVDQIRSLLKVSGANYVSNH